MPNGDLSVPRNEIDRLRADLAALKEYASRNNERQDSELREIGKRVEDLTERTNSAVVLISSLQKRMVVWLWICIAVIALLVITFGAIQCSFYGSISDLKDFVGRH
jgi:hypothetical protein